MRRRQNRDRICLQLLDKKGLTAEYLPDRTGHTDEASVGMSGFSIVSISFPGKPSSGYVSRIAQGVATIEVRATLTRRCCRTPYRSADSVATIS